MARPLKPPVGYGAYAPPSTANSRPVVEVVTVMVPVGVVQVGSVALKVAVGAPGAVPIDWFSVVSQPAAFLTLMV